MRAAVVYRMFSASGELLYVGASVAPLERFGVHQAAPWWREAATIRLQHFDSPDEALDEEVRAIREERPRFNKRTIRGGLPRWSYREARVNPRGTDLDEVLAAIDDLRSLLVAEPEEASA